jgi:nicotinamidase-related amidase
MKKLSMKPEETVLLIIDLQEKLMKAMKDKDRVYKNTSLLLETAKQFDIPVIVTEQYPRGLGPTVAEVTEKLPEHTCVEKTSFSACTPDFNQVLSQTKRRSIIIAGSETHICVFQTARDLVEDGFQVYVPRDAVCSRTDENYENGLELMKLAGAVITNTETIIFDLLKQAGTPPFKAISPLLK